MSQPICTRLRPRLLPAPCLAMPAPGAPQVARIPTQSSVPSDPAAWLTMPVCGGPGAAHIPTQRSARTGGRIYVLFTACEHGCLPCVRKLIEDEGLDPHDGQLRVNMWRLTLPSGSDRRAPNLASTTKL